MTDTKHIQIKDFDYPLPDERIAKFPVAERDHSKLLVYRHGEVSDDMFYNLSTYVPKNTLMVFNNTRVIRARLHFTKTTGALIEVFLLEPACPADYEQMFHTTEQCSWYCLVGNLKKWKTGKLETKINVNGIEINFAAERLGEHGTSHEVRFTWDNPDISFAEIIDKAGELPIPPYLNRDTQESDLTTYQTVYSKIKGSVAAPTAGLHFTERVFKDLEEHGIEREELTLHVGAGTFRPVKSEDIAGHTMHTEYISVRKKTIEKIISYDAQVTAVGTTSVRTLESLYYIGVKLHSNPDATEEELHVNQWEPYEEHPQLTAVEALQEIVNYLDRHEISVLNTSTQIIIAPGYEYKIVKVLITNFHQPKSTLLLLVSAFVKGDWKNIYRYALSHDFRFLSYGDSSILIP